jgi:hypothetical protein
MISNITANQLRHAAEIKDKIETLEGELAALLNGTAPAKRLGRPPASGKKGKRTMSAAGRARIAAAARARWKKAKAAGRNSL